MRISEKQAEFIKEQIASACGRITPGIRETMDNNLLPIILWSPLKHTEFIIHCPNHDQIALQDTGLWNNHGDFRKPRLLYHLGQNVLLVAALYRCSVCGGKALYNATHPDIIGQIPKALAPPFHLFLKSGITREGYETIVNATLAGTPFKEISSIFARSHGFHVGLHGESEVGYKHSSPSYYFVRDCLLYTSPSPRDRG